MRFTRKLPKKEGFYLLMRKASATPEVIYVKDNKYSYEEAFYGDEKYTFPIESLRQYAFYGPLYIQPEGLWRG